MWDRGCDPSVMTAVGKGPELPIGSRQSSPAAVTSLWAGLWRWDGVGLFPDPPSPGELHKTQRPRQSLQGLKLFPFIQMPQITHQI